jgi:hypothetical protein
MIADELRRDADVFTDLVELQSKIGRADVGPILRPSDRDAGNYGLEASASERGEVS